MLANPALERLTQGGFPEATRRNEARRGKFFEAYAHDLVERDVSQLSDVPRREGLHHLLRATASLPAQLLKTERLASDAGGGFTCPGSGFFTGLPEGGGIIALFGGGSIAVTGAGRVSADATSLHGSSGGQILLRALSVDTGSLGVSAKGAIGIHSTAEFRIGSPGVITIFYRDTLTGTTDPAPLNQMVSAP